MNKYLSFIKYLTIILIVFLVMLFIRIKYFDSSKLNLLIYKGVGFEPGFYFDLKTEDAKSASFEINTQEGNKYMGTLNFTKFTDEEKTLSGKLKDLENKDVSAEVSIIKKDCTEASGKVDQYTTSVKIGMQTWSGCVEVE